MKIFSQNIDKDFLKWALTSKKNNWLTLSLDSHCSNIFLSIVPLPQECWYFDLEKNCIITYFLLAFFPFCSQNFLIVKMAPLWTHWSCVCIPKGSHFFFSLTFKLIDTKILSSSRKWAFLICLWIVRSMDNGFSFS